VSRKGKKVKKEVKWSNVFLKKFGEEGERREKIML
jgi:hypothetical protein